MDERRDWDDRRRIARRSTRRRRPRESLWTRRSALALTAGFFALGGTPALARAFAQTRQPRANHIVVSKTQPGAGADVRARRR